MRNTGEGARNTWATFVKAAREAAKMTGAELARRLDVDRATIWRWETGKQKPETVTSVAEVAAVLGVDREEALAAAGLKLDTPAPARPSETLDPALRTLAELLANPSTNDATKDYIRKQLDLLANLPEAPTPPAPGRRRAS